MNMPSIIELLEKQGHTPSIIQPALNNLRLKIEREKSKQSQSVENNDCYWGIADIADYIGLGRLHVRTKIITDPRWPAPIICGGRKDRPIKRWLASDVKKALLHFYE